MVSNIQRITEEHASQLAFCFGHNLGLHLMNALVEVTVNADQKMAAELPLNFANYMQSLEETSLPYNTQNLCILVDKAIDFLVGTQGTVALLATLTEGNTSESAEEIKEGHLSQLEEVRSSTNSISTGVHSEGFVIKNPTYAVEGLTLLMFSMELI